MSKLWEALVNLLYDIGGRSGCHRLPERSFFWRGRQFPVCARCTGVCIGQLAAIAANLFTDLHYGISLVCLIAMGADWGLQEAGIKTSTNRRRLLTGIMGGFGLFNLYMAGFKKLLGFSGKIKEAPARKTAGGQRNTAK